ncbi:hypothetical protein [Sorangium sp. So ce145]|uniref:hypothetical protein n=1 Tax=Sorangium sp. So ce145 TaxID=3133285 RepID=UPI003F637033
MRDRRVVPHLGHAEGKALLDERHPELALFAAWAMQHRHGPAARAVVERAFELTERLPRALRQAATATTVREALGMKAPGARARPRTPGRSRPASPSRS